MLFVANYERATLRSRSKKEGRGLDICGRAARKQVRFKNSFFYNCIIFIYYCQKMPKKVKKVFKSARIHVKRIYGREEAIWGVVYLRD